MQTMIDTAAASAYDADLVPEVFRPWADLMVQKARLQTGMQTLDVACGTGVVARCAARACGPHGRTSGVDIDPAMIAVARAAALREGLQIDFHCGSAGELPFAAGSFDAALCLQGLQYFPDTPQALAELRRVMRTGATLVVAVWTEMKVCAGNWAMLTALERLRLDTDALRKPFALADCAALRALLEDAGFAEVTLEVAHRMVRFASTQAFLASMARGAPSSGRALAQVTPSQWPDFLADVEAQLAAWTQNACLQFPMASSVLVARR